MKLFKKKYDFKKVNRVKDIVLYTLHAFEAKTYNKAIELMYERLVEAQKNEYEMRPQIEKASSSTDQSKDNA